MRDWGWMDIRIGNRLISWFPALIVLTVFGVAAYLS